MTPKFCFFKTKISDYQVKNGPDPKDLYVASLYFTMTTLTSVGFGNIAANSAAEQIFCVVVLIFGGEFFFNHFTRFNKVS